MMQAFLFTPHKSHKIIGCEIIYILLDESFNLSRKNKGSMIVYLSTF